MSSGAVVLYYFPPSFYSQIARVALSEKDVQYKSVIINLRASEQSQPWYLKINPYGQVPLLKVGDTYIPGSDNIIQAVDQLNTAPSCVQLNPDPTTAEGKIVSDWYSKLNQIDIEGITFGILLNPDLSLTGMPLAPQMTKEGYCENMKKSVESLENMKKSHPELQDALEAKIRANKARATGERFERSKIVALMDELQDVIDCVESQLRKSRTENILEHWLCGPRFTSADIFLCVLIGRLEMLGVITRYMNPEKYPALMEYWTQAQRRPCVKRVVLGIAHDMKMYVTKKFLTKMSKGAAAAGLAIALGIIIRRVYKS